MKKVFIVICLTILVVIGSSFYKTKSIPVLIHRSVDVDNNIKGVALAKKNPKEDDRVLLTLEIPKINLKKDIYYMDSSKNNVDYNVEILKESTLPGNGISHLFFAAHRGNSRVSYFEDLNKLDSGDVVNIHYNNNLYVYRIVYYFITDKDGTISVNLDDLKDSVTLITCIKDKKDKQIVYIGYKI